MKQVTKSFATFAIHVRNHSVMGEALPLFYKVVWREAAGRSIAPSRCEDTDSIGLLDVLVDDGLERAVGGQFGQRLVDLLQQVGVFLGDGDGVVLNGIFSVEDVQTLVGRDQRLCRLVVEDDAVDLPVLQGFDGVGRLAEGLDSAETGIWQKTQRIWMSGF